MSVKLKESEAMGGSPNLPISTAPAVDPARIERKALGLSFFFSGCRVVIVEVRGIVSFQKVN